jgi:hypothetical protein
MGCSAFLTPCFILVTRQIETSIQNMGIRKCLHLDTISRFEL